MSSFNVKGRIHQIGSVEQITEKFRKCEFVIELDADSKYPQTVLFQATGDRSEMVADFYSVGDEVAVEFNIRGREWTNPETGVARFFNSLEVWKIEGEGTAPAPSEKPEDDEVPTGPDYDGDTVF